MGKVDYFEKGKADREVYFTSQGFASLSRNIKPEDAAKLFLPNEVEDMMQVTRPFSKSKREWLRGWNHEH